MPARPARAALEAAMTADWLSVTALNRPVREDFAALDPGEAEALTQAWALKADWMLLDESEAREQAATLGISFTGALGILRKARLSRRIPSLKEETTSQSGAIFHPPGAGVAHVGWRKLRDGYH